ncbi:peptidase S8/S53 domain-containing protein [Syncephalis plumigaleata]|nr:peptidase S8/S53 domain-containing protein [Syncephalis plumigaleata]
MIASPHSSMHSTLKSLLLATSLLVFATANAAAQGQPTAFDKPVTVPAGQDSHKILPNAFMVELHEEPGTAGVTIEQEQLRKTIRLMNIPLRERGSLTHTMNSISIDVDNGHIGKISKLPQVKRVLPLHAGSEARLAAVDATPGDAFPFYHSMTGVDALHEKKIDGQGVKIGIIDTGIDYTHPALGGKFGPGNKVAYGYDFVGDAYNDMTLPVEDKDPKDCIGHGTHVAGLIAARNATFVGVAPSATLGAYRVASCFKQGEEDIVAKAMDRAAIDGMDVINLSLGFNRNWPESVTGVITERLASRGVIIVASMGNVAAGGIWEGLSPAIAPNAYAVAAFQTAKYRAYTISIAGDSTRKIPYTSWAFDMKPIGIVDTQIVALEAGNEFGCNPIKTSLTKKLVLIKNGGCHYRYKLLNAEAAGAIGAVIYNDSFGVIPFDPNFGSGDKFPFAGIEQSHGEYILKLIKAGPVKLTFNSKQEDFVDPNSSRVANFSGWGPGPRAEMKPDLGAPGTLMHSTFLNADTGSRTMSGTSMASAYTSGSIALYLQAKSAGGSTKTVDRQLMREAFQNNARPAADTSDNKRIASVALQGAGLIDVYQAINGALNVKPSRITLNDTQHRVNPKDNTQTQVIKITNNGTAKRTYTIMHKPAVSVRGLDDAGRAPVTPELNDESAIVTFDSNSVVVEPKKTVEVKISITQPAKLAESQLWIFSGYIVIDPAANTGKTPSSEAVHVPYLGVKGNFRDVHVLRPTKTFPLITVKDAALNNPVDTFTLANGNTPVLKYELGFGSSLVKAQVYNADTNAFVDNIPLKNTQWLGHNDVFNPLYIEEWDGSYSKADNNSKSGSKKVPNGKYYIKLMALRPYGDASKPEDFDEWRSPNFNIKHA